MAEIERVARGEAPPEEWTPRLTLNVDAFVPPEHVPEEALRVELARMTDACRGGVAGECRILETLADHSHGHCASPDHAQADAVGTGPA